MRCHAAGRRAGRPHAVAQPADHLSPVHAAQQQMRPPGAPRPHPPPRTLTQHRGGPAPLFAHTHTHTHTPPLPQWGGHLLELDETKFEWGTLYELECETVRPAAAPGKVCLHAPWVAAPGVWAARQRSVGQVGGLTHTLPPLPCGAGGAGAAAGRAGGLPHRAGRGLQLQHDHQVCKLPQPHARVSLGHQAGRADRCTRLLPLRLVLLQLFLVYCQVILC